MNVLIVEPSKFVTSVLRNVCAKYGMTTRFAHSGRGGLSELAHEGADLILMSYELGDMTGTEFFVQAKITRNGRNVPGILVSASHQAAMVSEALQAGITECFAKTEIQRLEDFLQQFSASALARFDGKVLLVEDSKTAALFARKVLEEMGLAVETIESAEQAITALTSNSYDIVITDYILAGSKSGLSVIRAIRQSPGRKSLTPILAMSSLVEPTRKIEILRNGANDFVLKPVIAEELRVRVGNLLTAQTLMRRLEAQSQAMRDMAMRDQLTGLFNRHYVQARLPELIANAEERKRPLSLIVIDIDHFKEVNDGHGHDIGDLALTDVAAGLSELTSEVSTDVLARFGGEEFILLLPQTDLDTAQLRAEALRLGIAAIRPAGLALTVSLGVATRQTGESFEALFRRADSAVYRAKQRGRNRVEIDS